MNKTPKEMSSEELYMKLERDGVNAQAAATVRGEKWRIWTGKFCHWLNIYSGSVVDILLYLI